jgi:hypothetical protein
MTDLFWSKPWDFLRSSEGAQGKCWICLEILLAAKVEGLATNVKKKKQCALLPRELAIPMMLGDESGILTYIYAKTRQAC